MSKQRTRFVEEADTVYEIDEYCLKKKGKKIPVQNTFAVAEKQQKKKVQKTTPG